MSARITTQFGRAVPPASRHSVTVHMPTWDIVEKFSTDPGSVIAQFQNCYPRMKPHRDIASLTSGILKRLRIKDKACLLFPSLQSAEQCYEFATSPRRDNGIDRKPVALHQIWIRCWKLKDIFYAILFPAESMPVLAGFWMIPTVGISSRMAEANLPYVKTVVELNLLEHQPRSNFDSQAHQTVRERIVRHLNRAALHPELRKELLADDVYLFSTGMAAIYRPYIWLSSLHKGTVILFGMAFSITVNVFEEFGTGFKFFGCGTNTDLDNLELFLEEERIHGRKVSSIWAEFPANPLLVTPDLVRLRQLATKYDVVLAIDDTIGSFASVDILHCTDMVVTSLTKSFNGYADVIAGSAVLNPASSKYSELKQLFTTNYLPELYHADAEALDFNSRDYLQRTTTLNHNALALVNFLQAHAASPTSSVAKVFYPTTQTSGAKYYETFLRRSTAEFTPGYGCLFTVEFDDLPTTIAFYDNLNVHNGPHLGLQYTLAFAYTKCAYGRKLDWAAEYGLKPTQIRVSAGLEDTQMLIEDFRTAVEAADRVKRQTQESQ